MTQSFEFLTFFKWYGFRVKNRTSNKIHYADFWVCMQKCTKINMRLANMYCLFGVN